MSRATTKPAPQMAYITIGHSDFLLDASKAMKVAELMQSADHRPPVHVRPA